MINLFNRRFTRTAAVFLSGTLVLAACGGSNDSSESSGTPTKNAALAVSNVTLKPVVTSFSGSWSYSLAVDDAGNVYGFGTSAGAKGFGVRDNGQIAVPELQKGASAFTAVSAGFQHSLALDDLGNMYASGQNYQGQLNVPKLRDGGSRFTAVSTGWYHSLALDDKGNLYAFGGNGNGQTNVPQLQGGASKFTAVSAGLLHSVALDDLGNMYAFGSNDRGQTNVPQLQGGGSRFTSVGAGYQHSVALDDKGNMYAFGSNDRGQTNVPQLQGGASKFTTVSAGVFHSLALDDKGKMYAYGDNQLFGQLNVPELRAGGSAFTAVAAGWYHSLAIDDKGNMYAFGMGNDGQTTLPPSLGGSTLRTMPIAMGGTQAVALDEQGIATNLTYPYNPTNAELLSIAVSERHGLGITRSGSVVGWGDNSVGQLNVPDFTGAVQVVAGYSYSVALRSDGRVIEWGAHTAPAGKLIEKPADLERIVSLAGGFTHLLGITQSGSVVGWGDNSYGKATPTEGLSNVVAIAANTTCSVAAANNGALTWWGSCPEYFTNKTSLQNITAIALTDSHAVAIVDGSLVIWGMNEDGSAVLEEDIVITKTDSTILAISAGNDAFLAVDQKGNVTSWGRNWDNTITIPEAFGGPVPIIDDSICIDCEQPKEMTDEQFEEILPFLIASFTPDQKAKAITTLGGSTTKVLSPEEIQALIDAAKKEDRTEALATVREVASANNAPSVDPATATASTLPVSQSPMTKVNTTITTKRAVTLLGLKKVTQVAFVVPKKASVGACAVTKTQVTTGTAGVCNVKVTYTDSKKKKRSTTLTLVVG